MKAETIRLEEGKFYCSIYDFEGILGESGCGKICKCYDPLNGKNGICRFSKVTKPIKIAAK